MKISISIIIILIILFQATAKGNNVSALLSSQIVKSSVYSIDTIYLSAKKQENSTNSIKLEWTNPDQPQLTLIVDDASFESSRNIQPLKEGWLGNYYPYNWVCKLYSAELFWLGDSVYSDESLTVDIFDTNHMVLGSSDPFIPKAGGLQIVHLPLIQINGPFYAMVHWNSLSGESLKLGSDENGPGAINNHGWYYNGSDWSHPSDSGYLPNVFGLRLVGEINGKGSGVNFILPEGEYTNNKLASNQTSTLGKSDAELYKPGKNVSMDGVTEYHIFKRAYLADPPGANNPGNGDFILLATVPGSTNQFVDTDLLNIPQNCYEYKVQGITESYEIINSNIDWECLTVGIEEIAIKAGIFPNPANEIVKIELSASMKSMTLLNSVGQIIRKENITNQPYVFINTSFYLSGIYYIRFTTNDGDSFIRKLVVVH